MTDRVKKYSRVVKITLSTCLVHREIAMQNVSAIVFLPAARAMEARRGTGLGVVLVITLRSTRLDNYHGRGFWNGS